MKRTRYDEKDFVCYHIIPTIVVCATDNVLAIEFKWWSFSFGITIVREWLDN